LAERLIKRGEYSEAISEYYTAASLFEKGGFGLKSIAVLKQCLKIDPTNLETEKQLISAFVSNGLTGDAISEFQRIMTEKGFFHDNAPREDFIRFCLNLLGDIPEIHTYVIKDYLGEKNSVGIISSIEKTVPKILSKRQLDNFHAFLEGVAGEFDNPSIIWEVYALSLLSAGFKEKGFGMLERIEMTDDPDDATKRSMEEVKRYFEDVESDLSFPRYFSSVLDYLESLRQEEEEKAKLEVAKEEDEKPPEEEEEDIGGVLDKLREKVETEIGEEDLNARYNLGIAFKEMGLYDEAIREFDIANRDPNLYFSSMLMLKDCYESIERFDEALSIINELIEKGGDDKRAELDLLYQKASILDKTGHDEEAKQLYTQIYELDENFRDVAERLKSS
jgi:tetratricopeptide (TPR) repeat protein